jgi:hypothetical protein
MKRINFTLGILFLVLASRAQSSAGKEQLVVPLSEPGKPCKVKAHVLYGSIKVVGYEGNEIVIDVSGDSIHSNRRHRDDQESEGGLHRIGGGNGGLDVTAEEKNNSVDINSGLSHVSVLLIKVPQNLSSLNLNAVNDGSISVSNVRGDLEINNVNGPITLKNIGGSVVANTVNGDITVTFKSVDEKAPMAFSTLNGNVDVTFPSDLKTNVKLKSDRGQMYTDFNLAVDASPAKVNKTMEGHMYRINIEDWVYGKIGGGGTEMMMKTMNGDIYIRKVK